MCYDILVTWGRVCDGLVCFAFSSGVVSEVFTQSNETFELGSNEVICSSKYVFLAAGHLSTSISIVRTHLRVPHWILMCRLSFRVGSDPGWMQLRSEPESRIFADGATPTPARERGTDARALDVLYPKSPARKNTAILDPWLA